MDAPRGLWLSQWGKSLSAIAQKCYEPYWNKSWKKPPTKQQHYVHLPPICKTIQIRRTRHAGHCGRNKGEFIIDILQWTPTPGREVVGSSARTYLQQLCKNTGYSVDDLLNAIDDRDEWRERVRDIRVRSTIWWWWWWWWYICTHYVCVHVRACSRKRRLHIYIYIYIYIYGILA